ncbi:Hypothetical protein NAEGRDRAFT_58368 [Naegleria gruberi]|uniref:DUF4116 domain-containing protein n=1 Tax=Naegleria gruberi TaxID=5762 RepID=D2VJ45_NAEGR|nr:uncharacterized protein NAEGRDRAFT_58368 [Naegleria gruberi]EFC43214.1 Hypothetical protein NAEGRDRAFT_58368 [Naegleria gruberi]|eukprot:XP_002675958.1 Hypothetical protein NAEGRDRAFT_58368 [Naegleria gruberi strain NEG-M]
MPRTRSSTTKKQSTKRKHEETSTSDDSEIKIRKINNNKKNRDEGDDEEIDNQSVDNQATTTKKKESKKDRWYAYESSVYKIDLTTLLSKLVALSQSEIFFNFQKIRDEMIKTILKNYEETLMIAENNRNCCSILTHGQLHLNESVQYKRNQCKIIQDENCHEVYLCVHSLEFTNQSAKNEQMFACDGWLIYRCDRMKGDEHAFSTIHGHMIGDKINSKTLHWLGIHDSHCTIRRIEWEIKEIVDKKKENLPDPSPREQIEKELEKFKAIPLDNFIPNRVLEDRSMIIEQTAKLSTASDMMVVAKEFKLWNDKEFVIKLIEKSEYDLSYEIPKKLKKDRDVNLASAKKHGIISDGLEKDREIVMAAASSGNLSWLPKEFSNDREIVMAAVANNGRILRGVGDELKNDREIVRKAIENDGCAIADAPEEFQKDRELAEMAVKQNGRAFICLKEFENDRELLKIAIKGDTTIIDKLPFAIKNDREIIMLAVEKDGLAIKYASADLRNQKDIVMKAIEKNPDVLCYTPFEMRNDPEIKEYHSKLIAERQNK